MAYVFAGQYGPESFEDQTTGKPVPGVGFTVYAQGTTTKATLYTDRTKGTTAANPGAADANGNITFFADPGRWDLVVNGRTFTVTVYPDTADVEDVTTLLDQLAGKAADAAVVHLAGSETVTGAKDFTGGLSKGGNAVVDTTDGRLSDARTPLAHAHAEADVASLVADLGTRINYRGAWAASTVYATNDAVSYNGGFYRALAGFTSGASFNKANWHEIVPQSGTYAPLRKPVVYNPTHLRRWSAKVAQAIQTQVYLACVGDSITVGAWASTLHPNPSTVTEQNQWRDWGWAGTLRALLSRDYGYAGLGSSNFGTDEPAWTSSGAPTNSSTIGPMQTGERIAAGDTLTIYTAACTSLDIIYWWTTGAGQFTYTVDGGSSVTSAAGSGSDAFFKESITGLPNVPHTIVISGPATGYAYLSQWVAKSSATGVMVSRMAKSGATSATLAFAVAGVANATNQTRLFKSMFARPGSVTDCAVIALGYNDAANQATNNITPTIYRANLKAATDFISGNGGCTLLVAEPRSSSDSSPYTQQNYYDQALDLSNTDDHVAFMDLNDVFGSYALANANGQNWGSGVDTIHPNKAGHAALGLAIYHALTDKGLVNA